VKAFSAPKTTLGTLDAEATAALITAVTDVALVIDADGLIRDISIQSEDLAAELDSAGSWFGRPFAETVTVESVAKVRALLKDAFAGAPGRQRHINHPSPNGVDVPVLYSATRIGRTKTLLVCGRDLRTISTLQRKLLDAQQSMERDYSRMRQVETRYRMLFQLSPEAVVIVDSLTQRVVEVNPAAARLLDEPAARLTDRNITEFFNAEGQLALQALLAGMRVAARGDEVRARLADNRRDVAVAATLFRQDTSTFFLIRLMPLADGAVAAAESSGRAKFLRLIEHAPDGIVITTQDGSILTANQSFLEMAELAAEEQARGERLDRWLGRQGVDLDVLLGNLRQRGSVRLFATTLRGEFGGSVDVELSAASVGDDDTICFGFTIRNVGRRAGAAGSPAAERRAMLELPRSIEQLTELIGRVSLKDLVRESTDMIERLCIEAALEVTGDNRASAAEMLGLSRQSLYVKLRRYGLGDLDEPGEKE
jgi:transcriptional regulator PpsR